MMDKGIAGVKLYVKGKNKYTYLRFHGRSLGSVLPTIVVRKKSNGVIREHAPQNGSVGLDLRHIKEPIIIYSHYKFEYELCGDELIENKFIKHPADDTGYLFINRDIPKLIKLDKNILLQLIGVDGQQSDIEIASKMRNFVYINVNTGISTFTDYGLSFRQLGKKPIFGLCNNMSELYTYGLNILGIKSRRVSFRYSSAVKP